MNHTNTFAKESLAEGVVASLKSPTVTPPGVEILLFVRDFMNNSSSNPNAPVNELKLSSIMTFD